MSFKIITPIILFIILLSACGSLGGDPLDGTSWKLIAIGNSSPVAGSTVTLAFDSGQASGHSGCNSYGGTYKVNGNKLIFEQMMSTLMACVDQSMMEQESAYMKFLGDAQSFEIVDSQLHVYRSDSDALIFVQED